MDPREAAERFEQEFPHDFLRRREFLGRTAMLAGMAAGMGLLLDPETIVAEAAARQRKVPLPSPRNLPIDTVVVLMMENRSFDHMLGSLKAVDPNIDGYVDGDPYTNPDANNKPVKPQPSAKFQGQLQPDPDHHFPAVDLQIFGKDSDPKANNRQPNMQGFVASYFNQQRNLAHSQMILYYFPKDNLPVLTTLALEFAVFNRWFASIPGPTICNRAFAHYGTSFGHVGMEFKYFGNKYKRIYERLAPLLELRVPVPHAAFVEDGGGFVMVLEDLAQTGCTPYDGSVGVTADAAAVALEELADVLELARAWADNPLPAVKFHNLCARRARSDAPYQNRLATYSP